MKYFPTLKFHLEEERPGVKQKQKINSQHWTQERHWQKLDSHPHLFCPVLAGVTVILIFRVELPKFSHRFHLKIIHW